MKFRTFLTLAALAVMLAGTVAVAEEEAKPEGPTDLESAMAIYLKLAEPGEHHTHLDMLAGDWEFTIKMFDPGAAEPMESTGTMTARWVLGGRFLQSEVDGTVMGRPFQGIGIDGYDNGGKEYTSVWMDSMGTFIMNFTGECENDGKLRTMVAEFKDPASGQMMKSRSVTTVHDDGTYTYAGYLVLPDGSEMKQMELHATRK